MLHLIDTISGPFDYVLPFFFNLQEGIYLIIYEIKLSAVFMDLGSTAWHLYSR